jgi:hypothetical protein
MAEFLDFEPTTGVGQWVDVDDKNRLQVHYQQDVEPIIDLSSIERNGAHSDAAWRKTGLALYARIPPVTVLEIKHKYGVDLLSGKKDHMARAMKIIDQEYPRLKCTEKQHRVSERD